MARRNLMTTEFNSRIELAEEKWQIFFDKSELRWATERKEAESIEKDKIIAKEKAEKAAIQVLLNQDIQAEQFLKKFTISPPDYVTP